jgi:CheY-like chemotaxis protein
MEGMLRRLLGPEVRLVLASDEGLAYVRADPNQLEQVVLNLAVNARDAMPGGGTLSVETRNARVTERVVEEQLELEPGLYVVLAVSDTGTGMDRETMSRIFEPFFTTKEKGKGTGLGLATVYGIIRQNRAQVAVASEPGQGTTFTCYFPSAEPGGTAPASAVAPPVTQGRETILVVEDEPPILSLISAVLLRQGYTVLSAPDGPTARQLAASHAGRIDLLLSDGVLSGVRVPELLEEIRAVRPDTRVLITSGYAKETVLRDDTVGQATAFLEKPFTGPELAAKVRAVLDGTDG